MDDSFRAARQYYSCVRSNSLATNNAPNTTLAGQTGSGTFVGSASPTITTPVITQINDPSGHIALYMQTGYSNADSYITVANVPSGSPPEVQASGSATDLHLIYRAKGAGQHFFVSGSSVPQIWYSGTSFQHVTQWQIFNTAATRTVTIPDQDGTLLMAGQAFNSTNVQTLTAASGTYSATTGTKLAIFEMIGGGGSGGGTGATTAGQGVASGGGGGGGFIKLIATAAQIAGGVTYVIGAGAAAPAAGANGTAGAATTLTIGGSTWTAGAGGGGSAGGGFASAAQVAGGAGGGVATGANATLIYSANGDNALNGILLGISNYNQGGHGGNGMYGVGGGKGGFSSTAAASGAAGNSKGAGGGGSASVQSGGALPAGAGVAGVIIVTEFIAT